MSVSFSVNVYGTVNQQPTYHTGAGGNLPAIDATYPSAQVAKVSFPSSSVNVFPITGYGAIMAGNVSCYSIIEVPATGLNLHSEKYVAKETVATIATLRG